MNKEHVFLAGQRLVLAGQYKAHDSACRINFFACSRKGLASKGIFNLHFITFLP